MNKVESFLEPLYVTRPLLSGFNDFTQRLGAVWESQRLTNNGPQLKLLEKKLLQRLKVADISLFNNGTIALMLACKGLGLSGEVITTPFTFAATPHALVWNNIKPVFCDIDVVTMNIDAEKIESLITPQTTAILGVHVFGTPCDVVKIQDVADRHGLRVIYDAAHAFGLEINGRGIGTFGDISMFSFHATKLFHTAEGGALTYNDSNLKSHIDLLRNFGIKSEEEVVMPGINGKMNEIQAALGLVMLDYIDGEKEKRKLLLETYKTCLEGVEGISCLNFDNPHIEPSCQNFVIRIHEDSFGLSRDSVHEQFKKYNVFTRKYFYPLCSNYSYYEQLPSSNLHNLPIANLVANEVLSLPFYGDLSRDDAVKVCEILVRMKDNCQ